MVEVYKVFHPLGKNAVYLVRNKRYLEIPKSQDAFAFFDKAIVEAIKNNHLGFVPEIIHCNDHHTGLIPLLVKENGSEIFPLLSILFSKGPTFCPVETYVISTKAEVPA